MVRFPILIAACAVTLQTGCITFYSKSEVVRSDESRRPVRFETPETADSFHSACQNRNREVGACHAGIPFVTVYSKNRKLSEVAVWNDAVAKCDTDQDGTITQAEATVLAKWPNE